MGIVPSAIKPGFLVEAKASNGTECCAMYFGNSVEGGYSTTNVSSKAGAETTSDTTAEVERTSVTAAE